MKRVWVENHNTKFGQKFWNGLYSIIMEGTQQLTSYIYAYT